MDAPTFNGFFVREDQLVLVQDKNDILFSERALGKPLEHLVESIYKNGVRDPIKIVKSIENDEKVFKIVDGRNRYISGSEANRRRIADGLSPWTFPVIQVQTGGKPLEKAKETCLDIMIESNVMRDDNDPIEDAELMLRCRVEMGIDDDEIGKKFRKSAQTVRKYLELLDLEEEVKDAIRFRRIPVTFGYDMVVRGLDRKGQLEELAKILENAPELAPGQEPPKKTARKVASTGTGRGFKAPSSKIINHFRENLEEKITKIGQLETRDVVALVGWITGGIDEAEATKKAPILLELIEAAKAAKTEARQANKARRDAKSGKTPKAPKAPKTEGKKRGRPAKDAAKNAASKPKIEKVDVQPFSRSKEKATVAQ